MSDVKNRINKIKEYFSGMNVEGDVIYVTVKLPSNWTIIDSLQTDYGVMIIPGNEIGEHCFGASLDDGFDVLFNAIDEEIKIMKQAEERANLLKQKKEELEQLFDDESTTIEMLRSLEFKMKTPTKAGRPPKASFQNKEQKTEDNTETKVIEEENTCQMA